MILSFQNIGLILASIINLTLGGIVYFRHKKTGANLSYGLTVIFISAWALGLVAFDLTNNLNIALNWAKFYYMSAALIAGSFFYFSIVFGEQQKVNKIASKDKWHNISKKILIFLPSVIFIFTLFLSNSFSKGIVEHSWGKEVILGRAYYFYSFYFIVFMVWAFVNLFRKYLFMTGTIKMQLRYILIGTLVATIFGSLFNLILPLFHNYRFIWLGPYFSFVMVGSIGYAIVKRNLFGIKVILTQLLVILILALLLVDFVFSISLFEIAWKGSLFLLFLTAGLLLIKSVKKEIEQKDKLDKTAEALSTANIHLGTAYDKLKKLDKAKSEFISIASHQLRTPLTAIKGYVSMFLEGDYGPLSKQITEPMNNVYESNERLVKLVNSLLNLSRLEAGRIVIQKSQFSLEELIASLVRSFTTQLKSKRSVKLKFKRPRNKIPDILADKAKITEVISNLFDNAIKYTPNGTITAKLDYKKLKNEVLISVIDTGEGMTTDEISKLFKSFSRAGAGNKHWTEGTGLGLYVAKKFITMQGGKIWAESRGKGKGSTFFIELPIK